jgi:cytochrome P450
VVQDPVLLARVRAGDDALLERCANESIRIAQRSITLREVLRTVEVDDGERTYRLGPATMLTTMLSVTNTTAAPDLDHFDPDHYEGRRLSGDVAVATKELVSTFGHGTHACPAARFSISAIRIAVRRLVDTYDLEPRFPAPRVRRRQIGGVARAERPLRIRYRVRT